MNVPELCLAIYQLTQIITLLSAHIVLITNVTSVALLCFYLHRKKMNAACHLAFNMMLHDKGMGFARLVF